MDASKPVILLVGEIVLAHKEWDSLRAIAQLRQLSEGSRDQFLRDLKDGVYEGVVAISRTWDSTEITGRFDQTLVDLLPKTLRFVSHNGAGYDSIDAAACAARGIYVSNTPGAVDASTASVTIWLMLGALRRAHIPYMATRAGNWRGRMQLTHDPENKMLGILGMGGIGTAVAKRAVAFGMSIQYHNRHKLSQEKNTIGAKYVSFEDLLRTSDVISVHLPLNKGTRGMLGKKEFEMMKDGVVLVNTARGPIMDEATLVDALESGKVWGAGLDVYDREPLIHEGLLRNDHCILMPHVGTACFETQRKMEELVIRNLRSAITEGKLLTPVVESNAIVPLSNGTDEPRVESRTNNPAKNTLVTVERENFIEPHSNIEITTSLTATTTPATNGTITPEPTSAHTTSQQPTEQLTTTNSTNSTSSTLPSPAIPILDAINPEETSPPFPALTPPAQSGPNGIHPVDYDKKTTLWDPLTSKPPLVKKEYNWLELSPPLKAKDMDLVTVIPRSAEVVNDARSAEGGKNVVNGVDV